MNIKAFVIYKIMKNICRKCAHSCKVYLFTFAPQMLMFSNCILFYVAAQAVIENYLLTLLSWHSQ